MNIIVFDTETTGLLQPMAAGLDKQPYIVEFQAIKLDYDCHLGFRTIEELTFRCKPPIAIPEEVTRIHGITNDDVAESKPFAARFAQLTSFFLGSEILVAHNAMFDIMVTHWELVRIGKNFNIPWPPRTICTVEEIAKQKGFRMTLSDLHFELFGLRFDGSHTAHADCDATRKCFIEMVSKGMIAL